mgnify:CR=1 FL=1
MEKFETLDSARTMNIIDNILIEDALRDEQANQQITHKRAVLNKHYGIIGYDEDGEPTVNSGASQLNYVAQTENGFAGLEPPLG